MIRVGIVGYGNLGRGVELSLRQNQDMSLVAIFTRRDPLSLKPLTQGVKVEKLDDILSYKEKLDVLILCGGSKDDLPIQGPMLAKNFNIVDSYDNHGEIINYFDSVDKAAKDGKKTALISVGWDPGMFSLNRLYGEVVLPQGQTYTFWGKGLSQGHSDALRRVEGVKAGVQYTLPSKKAIDRVRSGENPELSTRDKHTRECFVVLEDGADAAKVSEAITTMPNYFEPYETIVHFIDQATLDSEHNTMPHGGFVIRSGATSDEHKQVLEYAIKLDSNPEFTASVIVAYTRATYRLSQRGEFGAKSVFDVAPNLLSPKEPRELMREML
ncbi:MAG: diaminopimelate dehydrogenase [Sulfurimonas sp.]|jgi:diaminopimelate dehydrogenase|nr:diaminopimelate dehydrogenase [Sulfurimonadaceae bacterium]